MTSSSFDFLEVGDELFLVAVNRVFLKYLAITNDRIEWRAQFMAHIGPELALGSIGDFRLFACFLKFEILSSKLRNVGVDGDRAAPLNTALADADKATAVSVFSEPTGMLVPRLPLRDPVLRALASKVDQRTRDHRLQHLSERGARLNNIGNTRINIAELLVEKNDTVFGIVKHETFGDRRNRGRYGFALRLGLGCKAVALLEAVTKQTKGVRHGADFVRAGRGDRHCEVACAQAIDGPDKLAKRPRDRAQDRKCEQHSQDQDQQIGNQRAVRRGSYVGDDLIAFGDQLVPQFADERNQQVIDLDAVIARLRQQRIAENALVVGIFVYRLVGGVLEFVSLCANRRHQFGLAQRELIQMAVHATAGSRRAAFRWREQADGQIGEPVPHFAKGDTGTVCRFDYAAQFGFLRYRSRIVCELIRKIQIGGDDHAQQDARQNDEA